MVDSRFWRGIAVALVSGVFYLAHGLHGTASQVPSLVGEVQAGDVATAVGGGSTSAKIITSSDDGQTIHVWSASTTGSSVRFVGTFSAKKEGVMEATFLTVRSISETIRQTVGPLAIGRYHHGLAVRIGWKGPPGIRPSFRFSQHGSILNDG